MIDKIIITLSDSGFVNINIGDVHFIHTDQMNEVYSNIHLAITKLAYFPSNPNDLSKPITLEEFKQKIKKK